MEVIELTAGQSVLSIIPEIGGSIGSLRFRNREILVPLGKIPGFDAKIAGTALMPFSNRIGGCAFVWEGQSLHVPCHVAEEPLPLHGDGWQRRWIVVHREPQILRLRLDWGQIGPFHYWAVQEFRLEPRRLHWSLSIGNLADRSLPYGFGFHPWFPRGPQSTLAFSADRLWLNDEQFLSERNVAIDAMPEWDYRTPSSLPKGFINNAFVGWDGRAELSQGDKFVSVRLQSSGNLTTAIVYSPNEKSNFVCFEPVSHPINAHNLPGMPGLKSLASGESATAWVELSWPSEIRRAAP